MLARWAFSAKVTVTIGKPKTLCLQTHRSKLLRLFVANLAALAAAASSHAQLPAFPGAEGFGSTASGGRGGDVYTVTNLNASGVGSFAHAIETAPATGRTVVFAVSGHIRLPSGSGGGFTLAKNNITVAGQTAPGDGICFWNNTMNLTGNDLVIRHIRWRYGKQVASGDAVDIANSQRLILDHCEVMFSTDENLSSFGTPPDLFTFQWSINAWGLSGHSCGGLWEMDHATAHHTLWANNHTRNPKCISPTLLDWVNNVSFGWNYGFNMAATTDPISRVNIRGSTFSHGGSTGEAIYGGGINPDGTPIFQLHVHDSILDGNANGVLDTSRSNYAMVNATGYTPVSTPWPQALQGSTSGSPVGTPVSTDPRSLAYKKVLSQVGATRMEIGSRPLRDEISQLCVQRTANLQRGIIADPLELRLSTGTSQARLETSRAPTDTDLDGMPDFWESALGTNPNVADQQIALNQAQTEASFFPLGSPAGYTRLEEYLHFKAVAHGSVTKNTTDAPSAIEIDLRKFTSGFTLAPVFTLSRIYGGTVSQSGTGNAIVTFTPTRDFSGRAGFDFTVTDASGDRWTQQCCLLVTTQTAARPVTWVGDSSQNRWDTTTSNFTSLSGQTAFRAGDAVTILDSGSNTPNIQLGGSSDAPLLPTSLTVDNSLKPFTIVGPGVIGGTASLTKSGTATLTLTADHRYTGPTNLEEGALTIGAGGNTGMIGSGLLTLGHGTTFSNGLSPNVQPILSAPIAIPANHSATIRSGGRLSLTGSLTGQGELTIENQTTVSRLDLRGATAAFAGDLRFTRATTVGGGGIRTFFNGGSFSGFGAARLSLAAGCALQPQTNSGGNSFSIGALSGMGSLEGGTAGMCTYQLGALEIPTIFSGNIIGNAAVTKLGNAALTLSGDCSHTGPTQVQAGTLQFSGRITQSPLSVAATANLCGTGTSSAALTCASGATISPGESLGNAIGTLTAATVNLNSPVLKFDLPAAPTGQADAIVATGAMTLTGNVQWLFQASGDTIAPGSYTLLVAQGGISSQEATFTTNLPSDSRQTFRIEVSPAGSLPASVRLVVGGAPASLTWTGSNGGWWDRQTTAAWTGASPATFANFDAVTFDDSSSVGTITITQPVAPRSLTFQHTTARNYTVTGAPITGTTSLVKSGSGTLTLTTPQYTLSNAVTTAGSASVTVSSSSGIYPGMHVLGTGIPTGTTVRSVISATELLLTSPATASNAAATLVVETRNSFSGGTIIHDGAVVLACNQWQYYSSTTPPPSNTFGLGTGPITLNGGSLTLLGHTGNAQHLYGALPNDLIVPAGRTATLRSTLRGTSFGDLAGLRGRLTGSGTLQLVVNFAYGAVVGDWSEFAGVLRIARPSSGANDPRFLLGNSKGLPLAAVNLDQVTLACSATPSVDGLTIPIGSLSGNASATVAGATSGTAPVTWEIGALNQEGEFSGNFSPYGSAPIGVRKVGTGVLRLLGGGSVDAGIDIRQGVLSYGDTASDRLTTRAELNVNPSATLQLNAGAAITAAACEVFSGGTLRGQGTIRAPLICDGTVTPSSGTLTVVGNTQLSGTLEIATPADLWSINGDLSLSGHLALTATGLNPGRLVVARYSGNLTLGALTTSVADPTLLAFVDAAVPGEIALELVPTASWQAWLITAFGPGPYPTDIAGADPDQDGMSNLEEFLAQTNPTEALSQSPLVWSGALSNVWDVGISANWLHGTLARPFLQNRQVIIPATLTGATTIELRGNLQPGGVSAQNALHPVTLVGNGSLTGTFGLTVNSNGGLTVATSTPHTDTGPTRVVSGRLRVDLAPLASPTNQISRLSPLVIGSAELEIIGKPGTASSQTFASLAVMDGTQATIRLTPNGATSLALTLGNEWSLGTHSTLLLDLSAGNVEVLSNPPTTGWLLPGVSVKDSTGLTGPATVSDGKIVRYPQHTLQPNSNDASREFSSLLSSYPNLVLDWTNGGLLTQRAVHRLILDTSITGGTISLGATANRLGISSGEIRFFGNHDLTLSGGQVGNLNQSIHIMASGNQTLTMATAVSNGSGSLTISGTGSVILQAPNTFSGGLSILGPRVQQGVSGALGPVTGILTLQPGTLDLNGINTQLAAVLGSGDGVITNSNPTQARLTLGADGSSSTMAASLRDAAGTVSLQKSGAGTLTLATRNFHSGPTTVTAGTLRCTVDQALGSGQLLVRGGTVALGETRHTIPLLQLTSGEITGVNGSITADGFELVTGTVNTQLLGASATLRKTSSPFSNTATLASANGYGGATSLAAQSGSLVLAHESALGQSPSVELLGSGTAVVLAQGVTIRNTTITLRGTGANDGTSGNFGGALTTANLANSGWSGPIVIADATARIGTGNLGSLTIAGAIRGSGSFQTVGVSAGAGSSTGTVTLSAPSGQNSYSGSTSIVRGTLRLGADQTLPATTIVDVGSANVSDPTSFDLNGYSQTLAGVRRSSSNSSQVSTITNSSTTPATLTLNQSGSLSYSGRIQGNLTLVKSGAGTLTLSSAAVLAPSLTLKLEQGSLQLAGNHTVSALFINGVQQPAGSYHAGNAASRLSGTGILTVTTGPSTPSFENWISNIPGLTPSQTSRSADPDGDAINNALEFALGGSPTQADAQILPALTLTPSHAVITFSLRETALASAVLSIETTTSLATGSWTSLGITPTLDPNVVLSPPNQGMRAVTVRIPRDSLSPSPLFLRLRMTLP